MNHETCCSFPTVLTKDGPQSLTSTKKQYPRRLARLKHEFKQRVPPGSFLASRRHSGRTCATAAPVRENEFQSCTKYEYLVYLDRMCVWVVGTQRNPSVCRLLWLIISLDREVRKPSDHLIARCCTSSLIVKAISEVFVDEANILTLRLFALRILSCPAW